MEIQTSDGGIIGILKKVKSEVFADLADSQRADEEERKTNHAPLDAAKKQDTATVTIQTNFLEGDLKTRWTA